MTTPFHEVRFPLDISMRSFGGPERKTDVVTLGSGREARNSRWALSRRKYDAGFGIKSLREIATVIEFFEERRGMLYGFRWRDRLDFKSCPINETPTTNDQLIGVGDGVSRSFQLSKTYGRDFAPFTRLIDKPVKDSVTVSVNAVQLNLGVDYAIDDVTGFVNFMPNKAPPIGAIVRAGFLFDVPVRFDTDFFEVDMSGFDAGRIPKIPIVEIRL